ncbi:23274_t:CDS:1, partial [Gigaspora rosea]
LLELYEAIKKLQKDLAKDQDRDIRKNAKMLEKLLLNKDDLLGIQELIELLSPFVHVTTIISGDYYSTFSIMLPLINILQEHLFKKKEALIYLIVCQVYNKIELSFEDHWDEQEIEIYITSILDP